MKDLNQYKNQLDNIPEELRTRGQFCLWSYATDKDGRKTKRPFNPHHPDRLAEVNNPETFASFDYALNTLETAPASFDGLGIRVSDDIIGIDIDHCFDESGNMTAAARDILETLKTYAEISPSGHGLRLFCKAPGLKYDKQTYYIKHSDLEIYLPGVTNRFLTITGNVAQLEPITEVTEELQAVLEKYMRRPTKPTQSASDHVRSPLNLSDEEIIQKASNAANGGKFSALFNGEWESYYTSQSEADISLCSMLAFWCKKDPDMIDRLFRASGLYREKWEREDYRESTLANAIASTVNVYEPTPSAVSYLASDPVEMQDIPDPTDEDAPPIKSAATTSEPEAPAPELSPVQALDEFYAEIQSNRFEPIPTGLEQLDRALQGGFERKKLFTLAAAPGTGKTALAQFVFENMARKGHPVVYVNLEMDRSDLLSRSIARESHHFKNIHILDSDVTALEVKRGYQWTPEQKKAIDYTVAWYKGSVAPNFYYVTTNPENTGSITNGLSEILAKLEKITAEIVAKGNDAPLVCIDYLQYIDFDMYEGTRKPDNADAIKQTLAALKQFAMSHNTCVLVILANNRASNQEGRASMDSGRDTSNIEYSGDVMLSLVYTAVEEKWKYNTGVQDRNGNDKAGVIDLDFINDKIDYTLKMKQDYPLIAKLLTVKVVKGRSIQSRGAARFIYDGRYFAFEEDHGTPNPYWYE